MQFSPGQITFPQLTRVEGWSYNLGIITLIVPRVVITTVNLGVVEVGDRLFISTFTLATKGAIAGDLETEVMKNAGTATIVFLSAGATIQSRIPNCPTFKLPRIAFSTVGRITVGGTLTVQLSGRSFGSDSTVAPGQGRLYAFVIPGSV